MTNINSHSINCPSHFSNSFLSKYEQQPSYPLPSEDQLPFQPTSVHNKVEEVSESIESIVLWRAQHK